MDTKAIRYLTNLMREFDLVDLEVESPDLKVRMSKAKETVIAAPAPVVPLAAPAPSAPEAAPVEEFAGCTEVTAPIPGTFYTRPNPDAPIYASVGDRVEVGQVLCLIEAMKVFNEIKAECAGTVKKVCAEDGQAVEYGTQLFLVG